ncbi:Loganate O-methyltransferase [Handroanthus impetiginosus]|uniref:Loganate O-methyltransferase n=1 Tax=Handroanthus impetiginosus TaxID=429701 RepID=A0A2G9G329_9LAMI|nr:Loganate O-methyltransferase [Handroanthus impetiginosus]
MRMNSLYAMNAGEGPQSYFLNSSYQGGVIDVAKPIIEEEINTKLDIKNLPNRFCIADFGCSTGHNSFPAIQIITQAINQKYKSPKITSGTLEFSVFFNDAITNDFGTLFRSLPPNIRYHAKAVPGDFHGRLLQEYSLHFAYSSWSLHWLSTVPEAVADSSSPAWNKGEILYTRDRKLVCDAYLDQYEKDIGSFLESRAVEIVSGGLMTLLVPAVPDFWNPEREYTVTSDISYLLGSCLVDMAKKGRFNEAKVDSFNLPYYFPTPEQLKAILSKNQSFTTERFEIINDPGKHTLASVNARAAFFRAIHERLLSNHFGSDIMDELFELYMKKLEASPVFKNPDNDKTIVILAVLKRKLI